MRYSPLWQQADSYPAGLDRQLLGALWPAGGSTGAAASAVAATMNVNIPAGTMAVALQAGQGSALCRWDAAEVVTLAGASTQQRIDLVVCQVRDNQIDGGANNDFVFTSVMGTPAASNPAVPALPANAAAVCQVLIPGSVANLNTATLTDRRSPVLGIGTMPGARLWRTAGYTTAAGQPLTVPYDTKDDPFNMATISPADTAPKIIAPVTGRYRFTAQHMLQNPGAGIRQYVSAYKNGFAAGETVRGLDVISSAGHNPTTMVSDEILLNAGENVQILVWTSAALAANVGSTLNFFAMRLVSLT